MKTETNKPERVKCCHRIFRGSFTFRGKACSRFATVERNGRHYCTQHDPVAQKQAQEKRHETYKERWDAESKVRRLQTYAPDLLAALELFIEPGDSEKLRIARAAIARAKGEQQ